MPLSFKNGLPSITYFISFAVLMRTGTWNPKSWRSAWLKFFERLEGDFRPGKRRCRSGGMFRCYEIPAPYTIHEHVPFGRVFVRRR